MDFLDAFDRGDVVPTIEMGGLGPGYEQCIQLLTVELVRDALAGRMPDPNKLDHFGDDVIARCSEPLGGLTGAQVGAARELAYRLLKNGWQKTIQSAPRDRRIMFSRSFPDWANIPPIPSARR